MKIISLNKGLRALWYPIIFGLYLCCPPAQANNRLRQNQSQWQQNQISGTITDGTNPLPGVTIAVKGQQKMVVSDFDGKFTITVSSTDILIFTYLGFKTIAVPVEGRTVINIKMLEDATALQEVRVNAGYYSVKESERTGSIAKITSKDIEKQPVSNVLAVMQGRMAGVAIVQDSGSPGGNFQIKIRGINSLRADGNDPLYIIDGVPFSSETIGFSQTSGTTPSLTNPLNSINPSEIESLEVLKDADATAIYGSRGANGVVLITTKKGKAGKTTFSANASTAVGKVTRMLDLMNTEQYLAMRRKAFTNDGYTEYPSYAYDVNGTWDSNRYTDWQKVLIGGTAEISNFQASVSGGNSSTQYLLSGNYRKEGTVIPGNFEYGKGSVHFSMNHASDDQKFKLLFSAGYDAQKNNQPGVDLTATSRLLAPNAPALYTQNGELNWENSTWTNPLADLKSEFLSRINSLNANAVLSYNFLPELQFKTNFGFTDLTNNESRTRPSTMYDPSYGVGSQYSSLNTNATSRQSWIAEPQLNWYKTMGKSKLEALVGSTFQSQRTDRLFQFGANFSSNNLIHNLASASIRTVSRSDETIYKYQAFFARVNYNWDSRYIINITGRRDGSSRFGPGRQFANFGAVGAAWLFTNEPLLNDNTVLSFGKLRASYGITGNDQIGDYQFLDTYISSGNMYQGTIGLQPSRLYNPAFGWETNKKLEIALETGFLKDRIFLTAAWYRNRSSDQLVGIPLPATTGFNSLTANLGATVQNTGLEFTLRTVNFQDADFSWTTNLNVSANRNKLVAFPGLESSTYANRYVIGESINIFRLYHFTGMNPQTGVYEFADANGDGQITYADDRNVVVDLTPKYFGGFQNQLTYKKLQLDFLFQFVKQKNFSYRPGVPGDFINQLSSVSDSWQQPGDQSPNQRYTTGTNGEVVNAYYQYSDSDAAIVDASYIRLKNISLTYDLPLQLAKEVRCKLSFQAQNLLTFTSFNNGDPELAYSSYLPPLKVYSAGIQITF
ncbi:SusC/RagA family TonB-linked outer membrane protein [Flavobacterium bomense]|uniref:SusC/RagA family TonB-linked outer membrane protein n=1 Tax=Flavobacterium bomense TaxID=2497483 RepID=A0A432CJC6_9FLAO|nr:SusC/RagA family TonB-linked outer membrane protein [Flavobacterium bomense]RTZ02741.1 SusC/RagA family TonB-linked outer membrane protein [Flavobacterium bomense]